MEMGSKEAFIQRMKTIVVPEGFTWSFNWLGERSIQHYFLLQKLGDTELKFDQGGDGHTRFKTDKGWLSFDRTGVESSFHHGDVRADLNALVQAQLTRIEKRRAFLKLAIPIPSLPFVIAPDAVEGLKEKLKKTENLTFSPSGFGIGYMVTKKPARDGQQEHKRAGPELEKFLGQSPLYITKFDAD